MNILTQKPSSSIKNNIKTNTQHPLFSKDSVIILPQAYENRFLYPMSDKAEFSTTNPNYSGIRYTSDGLYLYSDHGGDDDDIWTSDKEYKTAVARKYTIVSVCKPIPYGGIENALFTTIGTVSAGFNLEFFDDFGIRFGYDGGGGYNYLEWHTNLWNQNQFNTVAITVDNVSQNINFSVNGKTPNSLFTTYGNKSYIGQGPIADTRLFSLGGTAYQNYWTNYYHFKGYVSLVALFPDRFLNQELLNNLSNNPWQILITDKSRYIRLSASNDPIIITSNIDSVWFGGGL